MTPLDLTRTPNTDPTEIYRYRDGLHAVDLLITGIVRLDFFTWLSRNPSNKAAICRALEIADRPTDVMLTLFTAMGLIETEEGVFCVTELAQEHLVKDSPWNLAPYYASLKDRPVAKDYLAVLKTDKPANWGSLKTEQDWHKAMETEAFASPFTAAMDCRGVYLAQAMAWQLNLRPYTRLLDIAGGSGIYACSLMAHHPHLQATVFEKPPVDRIAREQISRRGFAGRVSVAAGDLFKDALPGDCDVHLLSNVLHDWDVPVVKQLLAGSFRALRPGGMLVVHDAFINAAKTGPLPVAAYSALLMHTTQGKCYSTSEMEEHLTGAGFRSVNYFSTAADRGVMTASKEK